MSQITNTTRPLTDRMQAVLAFVLLLVMSILFFSVSRPGNIIGGEEFLHPYLVERGTVDIVNRPLALILLWLVEPVLGFNPLGYYALTILIWAISAFLLFLIIRLLSPNRPLFALICAVVFIFYIPEDFWYFIMSTQTTDMLGSTLGVMVSLYAYFKFTRVHRWEWLAAAAILAFATLMIREAAAPILGGLPVIVFVLERRFERWRWIGLAIWSAAVLLAVVRYALPVLGISSANYPSSVYSGVDVGSILKATVIQARFAILPLFWPGRERIFAVLPQVVLMSIIALLILFVLGRRLPDEPRTRLGEAAAWIGGSLAAAWLGVAAFLPTIYATRIERTQLLSKAGEAVLIVSVIWLIADLISMKWSGLRSVGRAGVLYVLMAGLAMGGYVQRQLDTFGATWENFSQIMTTLSDQVPNVDEGTLFVYIEHPNPYEAPFTAGYTFQFAIRYFYEDRATGLMPNEIHYGEYEFRDEGICFGEDSFGLQPRLYGWDEIIVIERDAAGDVVIVPTLPDALHTPERQAQYDPAARIREGLTAHLRETFGR